MVAGSNPVEGSSVFFPCLPWMYGLALLCIAVHYVSIRTFSKKQRDVVGVYMSVQKTTKYIHVHVGVRRGRGGRGGFLVF